MKFPVVDYRGADAARDFCASLADTGFGVLANHPLDQSLVEGIYAEWLGFFGSDAKYKYPQDPVKLDGYFSPKVSETAKGNTKRDLKEFFHIYPWGRYPAEVSDAAWRYYAAGSALAAEHMPENDSIEGLHHERLNGADRPGVVLSSAGICPCARRRNS